MFRDAGMLFSDAGPFPWMALANSGFNPLSRSAFSIATHLQDGISIFSQELL